MSTGLYNRTAGNVIRDALRYADIAGIETTVQAADFARGQDALNNVLAMLQSKQIALWSETEAVCPLNPSQQSYIVGTDHIFTDYVYTQMRVAAVSGATTLEVDSTVGMTAGDFIGIQLDSGVRQWTTIDTVTDSDTLTIVDSLDDDVAIDNTIYTYTTKIDQPVRVTDSRYSDSESGSDLPIWLVSRQEYFAIPDKTSSGAVNQVYYSRQLSNSPVYVWPTASTCNNVLKFTFIKPQYIPEDQSENVLIPVEWYNALTFLTAADLGVLYAIDSNRQVVLEQKAQSYLQDAIASNTDHTSIQFQPR
jgi:hypothetical protein